MEEHGTTRDIEVQIKNGRITGLFEYKSISRSKNLVKDVITALTFIGLVGNSVCGRMSISDLEAKLKSTRYEILDQKYEVLKSELESCKAQGFGEAS